ncbi:hypothetical protein FSP39_020962 [Pinctada imbricata]|uniref:Tc1-like transposase DDE domain-containing protein n=1 Tax=Pinctada imbricata TaxID=66713 RepID=A0AA89CAA4_PINIB|nr:hypothetical protein FSP39_020962 [Pinctada imbricata]
MADFKRKGRISPDIKLVIHQYRRKGFSCGKIRDLLYQHNAFQTSRISVWNIVRNQETKSKSRAGTGTKVKEIHRQIIHSWMKENPEITSKVLRDRLKRKLNLIVSDRYVRRLRSEIGWTAKRTAYCQLISIKNKEARLSWCLNALAVKETFHDVIFVDETTVEMCSSGRLHFYHSKSEMQRLPSKQPKPKHSYKVHVWGGISYRGRTHICIFTGIMDSVIYQQILQRNLLTFTSSVFPEGFRLYQDNDSKHKSRSTRKWMEEVNILQNVMETPASSPDLNPIENVWSTMKYHLQTYVKPKTKDELVNGIASFWSTLTTADCTKYINHIHRVIPHVVLNNGEPTVF